MIENQKEKPQGTVRRASWVASSSVKLLLELEVGDTMRIIAKGASN